MEDFTVPCPLVPSVPHINETGSGSTWSKSLRHAPCPTFSSYTTCEQERAAEFTASRFIYAQRDVEVARYKIARDGVQIIGVELHCRLKHWTIPGYVSEPIEGWENISKSNQRTDYLGSLTRSEDMDG